MSAPVQLYRELKARLAAVRAAHGGEDSPEEDEVLDLMDIAWSDLTVDERTLIDSAEV